MAESYRGLTIRIGGDTTKLTSALRAANGAISQTQKELRTLGQALRLDPSSVETYNMQLSYMGQHATNVAMKLTTLKDSLRQIKDEKVTVATFEGEEEAVSFEQYAEEYTQGMGSVSAAAARAKEELDSYTDTVARAHATVTSFAKEAAKIESSDLAGKIRESIDVGDAEGSIDRVKRLFAELPSYVSHSENELAKLVEGLARMGNEKLVSVDFVSGDWERQLDELVSEYGDAMEMIRSMQEEELSGADIFAVPDINAKFDERRDAVEQAFRGLASTIGDTMGEAYRSATEASDAALAGLDGLIEKAAKLEGVQFVHEKGNTNLEKVNKALDEMADVLGLDSAEAERFKGELGSMVDELAQADVKYKTLLKIERMHDLEVEIRKAEASVRSLSKAMADMKEPSDIERGFSAMAENVRMLDTQFKQLQSSVSSMGKVLDVDPGNAEAIDVALRAITESEQSVAEQAQRVQQELDAFAERGVSLESVTDRGKSAAQQLFDAATAASQARESYSLLAGEVEHYKNMIAIIEGRGEAKAQTFGLDEGTFNALLESTRQYVEAAEKAVGKDEARGEALKRLNARLAELGGTSQTATENFAKVAEAKEHMDSAMESENEAKYRKRMEELAGQLVQVNARMNDVDQSVRKLAETFASASTGNFMEGVFAGTDAEIAGLSAAFESSARRAEVFGGAARVISDNIGLAEQRARSFDDAMELGNRVIAKAGDGIENIRVAGFDTSGLDALREKFGSAGNAARVMQDDVANAFQAYTRASAQLGQMDPGDEGYEEQAKQVEQLAERLEVARQASADAAVYDKWEQYEQRIASVQTRMAELSGTAKGVSDASVKSLSDEMGEIAKRFKDFGFKDTGADKLLESMRLVNEDVKESSENFNTLRGLLRESPNDAELLDKVIKSAEDYAGKLLQRISMTRDALDSFDESNVDMFKIETGSTASELKRAEEAFERTKQRAKELEDRLRAAKDALEKLPKGADTTKAQQEIDELEKELREVSAEADKAGKHLEVMANSHTYATYKMQLEVDTSTLDKLDEQIDKRSFDKPTESAAAFQQALSRVANVAERAARQIVESANTIDSAYRDMRKTVQGTEDDFQRLYDEAIKFSQSNAVSADTMLSMEALGGQMGVGVEELGKFGSITSNITIATDLESSDAALKLGQIKNIMSDIDDIDTLERFADALVRLGNNAAAQESSIMQVAQRIAAVGNVTSMSSAQLLGWSAAVAETGLRSESAATGIINTITGIGKAVSAGGDKLEQFAKIAGMSADEFRDKWANSSSEALEAFVKGLSTLSDDSTAAIDALDSVGISSVRQSSTMLALSQTIENLDKNITMSQDAFLGLSDEWGRAGDAAREAQNKSEGFSGSLQILKNNAADLAASLGEGLQPFMDILVVVLRAATDALNMMPQPLKAVIVGIGGATVAASVLIPTLQALDKWFKASAASSGVLGTASSALSGVLTGPHVAAVLAVIAAITALYGAYDQWRQHTETLEKATTGLVESVSESSAAFARHQEEMAEASHVATSQIVEDVNEILEAQARLTDTFTDRWDGIETSAATVDAYAKKIAELTEQESLNAYQQSELRAAVEGYNSITGETISIVNAATGEIDTSTTSILENADAWKRHAESVAAMEMYQEAVASEVQAAMELDLINERLEEESRLMEEASERGSAARINEYNEYEVHAAQVKTLTEKQKELKDAVDSARETQEALIDKMEDSEEAVTKLKDALAAAGHTLSEYGSITDEELYQVAASYEGNIGRAIEMLEQLKAKKEEASSGVDVSVPTDDMVNSFKQRQSDEYDAEKRIRDQAYKDLQRQYSDDEAALKTHLDSEYKAAQEASKAYLSEVKRSYDAQTKAHKDATEQRVADLKEEYEQKKRLLEQEEQDYEDAIDARISALDKEQKADDRAGKKREQQQKLAELQQKVASARTVKARREAQQELANYQYDIAAEGRKNARTDEKDELEQQKKDLKSQLQDREQELKDSYDRSVSDYKSAREREYDTLKESLDRQYEAEQAAQTAYLEGIKTSNDATIASMSREHELALERQKYADEDYLKDYKRKQETALEVFKAGGEAIGDSAESARDAVSAATDEMATAVEDDTARVKAAYEDVVEAITTLFPSLADMPVVAQQSVTDALAFLEGGLTSESADTQKAFRELVDLCGPSLESLETTAKVVGANVPTELHNAILESADSPGKALDVPVQDMLRILKSLQDNFEVYGNNTIVGFTNQFSKGALSSVVTVQTWARDMTDRVKSAFGIASPSKEFAWIADMTMRGFEQGWDKGSARALSSVDGTAKDILSAFDITANDPARQIIDLMRAGESDLYLESKRMAEIVESGFDPRLTIAAATEAMGKIDAGELRRQQQVASAQTNNTDNRRFMINVNIPEVVVREEADIDRISNQIALRVQRQLSARIG